MFKSIRCFKITLLIALLTVMVGCSSNTERKNYFQLTSNLVNVDSVTTHSTNKFIWIESIEVASFLNKSGIVLQTQDIKYVTATNNLWASTLSQQFADRLSLKGRWVVTDNKGQIRTKVIERSVPLAKNGYSALVKALSQGWQDEELEFANSIKY